MYRITRVSDKKDYIGQKSFHTKSNPWPYYMSSSKGLKAEIEAAGPNYADLFNFDVLMLCGDRNSLSLAETTLQIFEDVIHNPNNFNKSIAGQKFLGPTKHTPETRQKISAALSGSHDGQHYPHFK